MIYIYTWVPGPVWLSLKLRPIPVHQANLLSPFACSRDLEHAAMFNSFFYSLLFIDPSPSRAIGIRPTLHACLQSIQPMQAGRPAVRQAVSNPTCPARSTLSRSSLIYLSAIGKSLPVAFLYCDRIVSDMASSLACSTALSLFWEPWPRNLSWT